jgi:Ca2+-binding EF-hand superfamily protein
VIDSKIVTKHDVLTLKNKFDEKCKNGWCSLKEAVVVVKGLGYLIDSSIDCESTVLVSFNNLLEILFKNANKNQINRLLRFSGMKIIEERIKEPEKNLTVRNIIDPRQVLMFKNIFERYDLNKDGKVDLKELKNLLKNSLNEESIEEMYEKYRRGSKGLNLEEFIKMHAPDDVEVPENLNIS